MSVSRFNDSIVEQLVRFFKPYGFVLIEKGQMILRFEASFIQISLIYDFRNNGYTLWLCNGNVIDFEIHEELLTRIHESPVPIHASTPELFVNNVITFLSTAGLPILEGDQKFIQSLEQLAYQDTLAYNKAMQQEFAIRAANNAWQLNDFTGYIKALKDVSLNDLPESYSLKLKIAIKKVSG